jgi:pimeloyl-ACP methyl ester carboxylesterase
MRSRSYDIWMACSCAGWLLLAATVQAGAKKPAGKLCYVNEEITIPSVDSVTIAGTLSIPTGSGRHGAVLMITGNGLQTRDQTVAKSPTYELIADHFARRGLAVLRTDARGAGASTGFPQWGVTTTADRVEDNRQVLAVLEKHARIDPERIVLFGHGEGATIASILAASGSNPALSILLVPTALPGTQVFAQQLVDNLKNSGATPEVIEAVKPQALRFADFIAHHADDRAQFETVALNLLTAHGVPPAAADLSMAEMLFGSYRQPWFIHFAGYDPGPDFKAIRTPVLAVYAGADSGLPWQDHLPPLVAALVEGGSADVTAVVLPDQDHFFLELEGRRIDKYEPGKMEIAQELYQVIDDVLGRHALITDPCIGPGPKPVQ